MYYVRDISLSFGGRVIFKDMSFMINPNEKIGLIGRNGTGKTTLFKIISKEIEPDKGKIDLPKGKTIGVLSQFLPENKERTIMDETLSVLEEFHRLEARLKVLETKLQDADIGEEVMTKLVDEMSELMERKNMMFDFNPEAEAEVLLKGLGFKQEQLYDKIGTLSGGWQMRIELAKLLLSRPDILLLDEPTNHLDIESIIWFEGYIKDYSKAVILISHDEEFMQNSVERIIEIANNNVYDYKGTYQKYLVHKEQMLEINRSSFNNQQKLIKEREMLIDRFRAKATKAKMAQSMIKQLDKVERVELIQDEIKDMVVKFPYSGRSVKAVVKVKDLSKSYGEKEVLREVDLNILKDEKIAFVGQNGMGKSTLLKAILAKVPINSGDVKIGDNVIVGYYAQDQSDTLDGSLTILETLERVAHPDYYNSARKILGSFLFSGEEVEKKVSVLSGGEKARVALACMVSQPSNFLVFDEPTNHLDVVSKNILKYAIRNFEGTVLIVSHDRSFLEGLSERTIEFRDYKLLEHLGDINYVLAKRKSDDLRAFTLAPNEKKAKKKKDSKEILNYEERKKLKRKINYAERDISKIEEKMAEYKKEMEDPKFFMQPDSDKKMKELGKLEKDLESKMEDWEKLSSQMTED